MKNYQKPLLEVMNLTVDAAIAISVIQSEPTVEDNSDDSENLSI